MSRALAHIQTDSSGKLIHLLSIEGLSRKLLLEILDTAATFINKKGEIVKSSRLTNKTAVNLFFENSTRTRSTFELAEKHLGLNVLTLNISTSSAQKGETLLDTLNNIQAMGVDLFIIRHSVSGAVQWLAQHLTKPVINAGDGCHEHPTQAILDMLTIRQYKRDFSKLAVAIIGDILHSRVARSQIHALKILGVSDIRVVAPQTLLPAQIEKLGVTAHCDFKQGIKNAEVIIMLRLQEERMQNGFLASKQEYFRFFGLTEEKLSYAKSDAIIMHPGPMNRGVEIAPNIADGKQSVILQQVYNGIAARMAVIQMLLKEVSTTRNWH